MQLRFREYIDTETGIQKVEFMHPRFQPAGDWSSKVELKSSLSGDLKSSFEIQVLSLTW